MCPHEVCVVCGEPRRRVVKQTDEAYARVAREAKEYGLRRTGSESGAAVGYAKGNKAQSLIQNGVVKPTIETLYWTSCLHGGFFRPGVVLDPFAGSGTTAVAAALNGRDCVLVDIDPRNVDLARERLSTSMLLVNEHREGNTWTWTVDASMPGTKNEAEGQISLFEVVD